MKLVDNSGENKNSLILAMLQLTYHILHPSVSDWEKTAMTLGSHLIPSNRSLNSAQ